MPLAKPLKPPGRFRDVAKRRRPTVQFLIHTPQGRQTLRRMGRDALDFKSGKLDFHIRKDRALGTWELNSFRSRIKDPNEAHVASSDHDSLEQAVAAAVEEARGFRPGPRRIHF